MLIADKRVEFVQREKKKDERKDAVYYGGCIYVYSPNLRERNRLSFKEILFSGPLIIKWLHPDDYGADSSKSLYKPTFLEQLGV